MLLLEKATRKHTRLHNRRLILRTIYTQGAISRVDIARQTQLTRTTVSGNVAELIDEALVAEVGIGESAVGKPPTLLSLVDDGRHLIGLDLAGTQLRGAIINLRGVVRCEVSSDAASHAGTAALDSIYTLVDQLIASTTSPILGIGVGAPGIIDTPAGIIKQAVNLDWHNVPLGDLLRSRYGLPVYVANDSHVAALAEHSFGAHKHVENLAVVKVGRGIGMGLVLNRRLFYGDSGGAGEIGHIVVVDRGSLCRCGNVGCLETVASSQALVQQAHSIAQQQPQSLLHLDALNGSDLTIDAVLLAWRAGEPALQPLIAHAGHYLGIALAHVVGTLNINHVIIAGSVAGFGPGLIDPLLAALRSRTLTTLADQTQIEASTLGPAIVSLGAAALLLSHELGLNQIA